MLRSEMVTDYLRALDLRDLEYRVVSGAETRIKQIGGPQQLTKILVEELGVQVTAAEGNRLFDGLCT